MKVQFKDFVPEDLTPMLAMSRKYESADQILDRINDWIAESGVNVLNIETIVRPVFSGESRGNSLSVDLGAVSLTQWVQTVRVWYS
jgi:hypothetical protein